MMILKAGENELTSRSPAERLIVMLEEMADNPRFVWELDRGCAKILLEGMRARALHAAEKANTQDACSVEMTLSEVLEVYQRHGLAAGVQVLGPDRACAWIGNIEEARLYPRWFGGGADVLFRSCQGPRAIRDAAAWLLDALPPGTGA